MKNNSKLKRVITILMSIIAIVGATIATNNIVKNNFKEGINKLNNHNYRASAEALRSAINGTQDVTFDAYFLDNSNITSKALLGPITGPIVSNVPNKEMYMELRVTGDGHLKDGKIAINGTNASVIATLVPDNVINGVYVGKASEIKLKNVASGTTRIIKVKVYPKVLNKDYFIRDDNKITFTGTYVANDGTETPLEKIVNFSVETMYDKVKAESTLINSGYINEYNYTDNQKPYAYFYLLNRGEQINNVQSNVSGLTSINNTIKEFEYRVQVPKFNGYNAESVNVTVNNYQNNNAETNYDKNTGELVIKYKYIGNNNTNIRVEYPVEAGKDKKNEELKLEGNLKLTAYNNTNYNPLESTSTSVVKAKINYYTRTETKYVPEYINFRGVPTADIPIDRYDGSTTTPKSETYNVEWNPYLDKELAGEVELTESKNDYCDKLLNPELNIGNVVTNKGISFYIDPTVLNENSTIKIYNDETNELIHTFDRNEIIEYQNKIYNYNTPIKHVKVVLNNINLNKRYAVKIRHEKEINDEELIKLTTKESFLNLRYIKSSFQQKTSDQTVTANTSANYIRTNTPSVGIYLERHNKIKEQATYNGQLPEEDNEFIYSMDINSTNGTKGIRVIDENGVAFGKTKNLFGDTIKADDYIHYKGIYFERNGNLPDNFNLKIYDNDTNQLVATFTKSDITKYYNKEKAFIYSNSIKHIRIDTNSTVNMKHIMNINTEELVKGINEKTYYNEAKYIVIKPKFARIVSEGQEYTNYIQLATNNDTFIQKSYITGSLNKPLNTYQKQKNVNQEISLKSEARNQENYYESTKASWKNSTVLIEYPEEIKKLEINKITPIDNSLEVVGYDKFEKDGKQYLKVYLQSEKPVNQPSFNIDSNITVDPLAKSKNTTAKIYYYNSYPSSYLQYINETKDIFDINNNGSTEDNVGYSTMNVTIVSPDTLVISQEITGYNTKGETTYAPGTGIIESNGTGIATVKVQLANYWTPSVSNIKLIGKIPFSNNISPLSKQALNSDFTTTMTSDGIQLPNDLNGIAKVYYSELVDPSMEDRSLWKTRDQITDWNNIKSFYIDLGSKVLGANATETITYNINVPLNVPMNEKSYATVAGTFDLNTERDGNLSSSAESNKVGIQLVKRYNLNITSLVKGRETAISNSLYSVENNEEDEESKISKTILTDTNGHAVAQNLKVNEEYTLTEKSIDENYESRNARIKFKLVEENGRLSLKITEGNEFVKESSEIQPTGTTNAEANIKIEYLKKYKITINKKSLFDKSNLKNVGYKLSSSNESNKYGNTDINGNLTFSGLKTNVIYTLTETVAPMHYINPEITFKVTESNGTPSISIIKGTAESINILETREKQNQANISILDEKVKTYTLKVVKYEKGNLNKRLAHAQFLITGDGILNGKVVETDDNGEATITGLYEYKPGQQYKGEYIIEELVPPEGYQGQYKVGLKVQRDAGNIARVMATTTELDIKNAEQDNPTVMLFAANEPLFKIIKKDAKTSELLPNTKFGISKVDDSGNESEALDINNNPVGTLENIGGKQYRTITTNEKGEYSAGLKSGKYKFVELQASNDKYELPQNESDRTYTVNVGEPTKAKYSFIEDKNLSKIPEVINDDKVGLRRTYVNGEVIHYTLQSNDANREYSIIIYDKEFNVKKQIKLTKDVFFGGDIPEVNIGKDGSIYLYHPKDGVIKFDSNGNLIKKVGDYFGYGSYNSYRMYEDKGTFGNSLFDNDTKSIPYKSPVIKNEDAKLLIPEITRWNGSFRKPSIKNGLLELNIKTDKNELIVYDNDLNIVSKIDVDINKDFLCGYFDQVYDDNDGNIYVNNNTTKKIDVYDRSGTLLRSIANDSQQFIVLPNGIIYFFYYNPTLKGETSVDVIAKNNNGDEIARTRLPTVDYYQTALRINVSAEGSIEYSDRYEGQANHKLDLHLDSPEQPPKSEIVIENKLKKFKITTSSTGAGTISGQGENPYEEVEIYSDSKKDIVVQAYRGYIISKITINDEEYPIQDTGFNPTKSETLVIDKFKNMTEDKHIHVEFSRLTKGPIKVAVRTYHYLKGTTTEVAPTTRKIYLENESYTTEPKILEKYELEKNEQGEYIIPDNATGTTSEPQANGNYNVIYYYVKKKAKVITKYILEKSDGSTEEIKSKEEQTLDIDSQYTTSSDLGNPKYELVRIEGNPRGTIESTDDINVKYVYKLKDAKVNVKYLDVTESETGTPLSSRDGTIIADKVINGQVDDVYRTQEAENVQPNYSLVETPNNASGNMTVEPITVIYKYRKVTPTINDINVSKVGPEKIISKTQLNLYNITFRVNISDYIGTGKVRLKDKLPYPIHYEESDKLAAGIELDGGIYNSETNEIIWDIPISDINTYEKSETTTENNIIKAQNGTSTTIEINKNIIIRYKDLPNYNQGEEPNMENTVLGKIMLDRNNEREVQANHRPIVSYNKAITIKKNWNDNNNIAGKRPQSVTFALYKTIDGNESKVGDYTLSGNNLTNDGWEKTIEQLPTYEGNIDTREMVSRNASETGMKVTYRVEETSINKFYQSALSIPSENENILTNTFTVPDEKIEVQVNKIWEDNSNENGKRPTSIKYVLNGGKTPLEQVVTGNTTTNDGWGYKFTNLAKYDDLGNEITYTVSEEEVNSGDLKFYTKAIKGFNITNTFIVPDEKVSVQVNKSWEDNSNANGKRPTSIKYVLTGNGLTKDQTVTGSTTTNDNWSYKFTDLPKYDAQGNEIVYTVAEQEATTDGLKFYSNEISGEYKTGITIKNTFKVPEDKIELEVTKHWEDNSNINGKRPISIKYVVSGNNKTKEEIVTGNTTTDENWNYKFTDLPKYDSQGNEIVYTIDEQEVTPGDLKFYNKSITGLNIVNTFHVPDERISVNVSKHWEDNSNINGKRPESIKYVLTGEGNVTEQVVTGNTTNDTDWNYTFTNLPKYNAQGNEIIYTIEEQEANQNDLKFYVKQANGNYKNGFNMVNTFKVPLETVDISVNKHWADDNNANGKRPTSIKYVLSGNNQTKEQTVTGNTTSDADWNYTFTNLPKYNSQGNEIVYTVDEQEVNPGDFKFYTKQVVGLNITNTFTVPDDKIEVQVNKVWEDNSNANAKRPASIKYVLSGNGLTKEQVVTGNTSTNEDWSYKFTDLPKYNAQGNEIAYTVVEQEAATDGLKFYTNEISGEYKTGITIKNKFKVPEDKIEVEVTKHWEDNNNANHRRPTSIKYVLKGNGLTKEQEVIGNISTDENWNYTFTNLPKYNAQGNEIVYTVDEQEVNTGDLKFYTKEVNGFNVTNTFKVPEDKVNVKATKTWIDSSNAKGKRPSSIKYILKGGATPIEKVVSGNNTRDENWSYTFENLAKYDSNGQEYQYSVEEEITENAHLYTKVITGNKESGFNVINTFKVPEDKLTIAVTKEWKDNSNVASKRPTSIKYVLKGGATPIEEVVSGNNTTDVDWNHTFTNVAKYNDSGDEITYTLEEQEVSANDFKFYKKAISGDYKAGFNVVNTFEVPDEKVEVQVNKVWEDDSNANTKRPASIKYILKGGATPVEHVVTGKTNSNADWSYKFTNLPKYSATGDEITYTLEEQEVNTDELKFYEKEITGSMNAGFNVKNKFKVPEDKVEARITKTWEDNSNVNGKRPASIKYVLSGNGSTKEQTVTGNTTTNDNWSYTFTNLPKYNSQGNEITYTVEEQEVNPGDLKFYEKQVNGDYQSGFNVTNTFRIPDDKVKVEITKKWEDSSNVSNKRPASVKVELSDGANVVRTQELTGTGNEWKHTFTDLPKYNSQGNTITYTLDEKEVNPGDLQFYTKSIVGNTITNTFTQSTDKINVNVSKTWNDSNNANRKRPVSIKYVLKNKETIASEKVVAGNETTDTDWNYTFTGLAKYDEHNDEIKYTLEEQEANEGELKFYTKQVNGDYKAGFNVVNTFKVPDERINVNVSKTWNDDSNSRGKRPSSIKYIITDGQNTVEQIVTGESNTDTNWSYEFSNLVKYEANTGNEISYTVREEEVNPGDLKFYEPTISGDYKAGINVTNKFVVPNDKVTPRVTITWEDNNNNGNKRPSNVKIIVKDKEGKVVKEGNVTGNPTDEEWNKVFENVPKYDKNGDPIPYTVEEKPNSPDDFKFYKITVTGDIDKGYKVTNKFEVPDEKITVKVKKVWEDSNNAANKRPTAIKVQLKNNAAIVREERVTGSGNEWTYTFENVAKYNGYGDVINYTVEEIEEQTEDLKFYEKKITGDKDSEYVITNKFKVPDEKIEINVNKTWEDNNNEANKRPTSIKYVLSGNNQTQEQVVSGNRTTDANWNYKFINLPKYNAQGNEITYTVEEQEVNANDLKFYTKKVSGEQTNGFAVVNKFTVPTDKVTVKVSKTWDDESNRANKRPSSIKYEVLNRNNQIVASKVQIGNKNTADGWSHNFELDKYDALGNEEVYNVQEVEVNQNDFKFYKATVSGNYKNGFTVTNKFEVPNEEVTPKITVEWKDNSNQNNKRPTSVKIQVKDEEGRIVKESPVTGLITEESWKKIFENVPKYNKNGDPINYTITEEPNNPNDLEFYTTTTSGNITEGFKVVNTYAVPGTTISLKANKKWVDGNNAKNKRPESIKIEVRNNNEVVADKEVKGNRTTDANWEVEFKNLPKYNPTTGAENVYTVTETEVHQGELRYYTSAVNGNTITNTIKPVTEGKIEDSKVEKESTLAKITKADEIVPYTITYKGKIKEYMGGAVVKIVDELPFKLDLSKSNITDGSYDDESKTITWIENLNNIDTHSNGDKEVEIKKEIKLVYKDLKISAENLKVTNKVRAEINLKETNKKITENNTKEIPAEIGSKVTVKYVLKSNRSMKLKEDKVITGHVGDAYQTTIPNDIDQDAYEFVEVEGNENGKISQEEKVVTYLYKKKFGRVVVSYVEKSTGMKLQNDEVIKGNINEPYNAEAKDIEYYNLVSTEKSENVKPVITEEDQKITHYYEKKVFNIEIDKELKEATIDGEKRTFRNGKFTKLDIPVKKILNSEVKVRYSINVKNTGEIKGTTVVQENIPKYFTMNPSENPDWRVENGKIVSKEIELNPGESKELSITLKWTNSKDNFGTLVNKVGIEKTKNNAGFEETDTEEEKKGKKQQATLVLVPKTGLDINKVLQMTGVGITLTALVAAMGYTISRKVRDEYINQ